MQRMLSVVLVFFCSWAASAGSAPGSSPNAVHGEPGGEYILPSFANQRANAVPLWHPNLQLELVEMSDFGVIHIFDHDDPTVYRFDVDEWSPLPPLDLPPDTRDISLDPQTGHLYVGQLGGRISVWPREAKYGEFLLDAPSGLRDVKALGEYLMTTHGDDAYIFDVATTQPIDYTNSGSYVNRHSRMTWNSSLQRLLYLNQSVRLNYLPIAPDGYFGSPSQLSLPGHSLHPPVRVHPGGAFILFGSGTLLEGPTLQVLGTLGESMTDATWLGFSLYVLRPSALSGRSELVNWTSGFSNVVRGTIPGLPIAVFTHKNEVIAVTRVNGDRRFFRYPASLSGTNVSSTITVSQATAPAGTILEWSASVVNEGLASIDVITTLDFNVVPEDLTLLCDLDGAPIHCDSETPINLSLDSGSTLAVQAWGSMPGSLETLVVTLTASAADSRPEDNQASVVVELERLFADGFEGL